MKKIWPIRKTLIAALLIFLTVLAVYFSSKLMFKAYSTEVPTETLLPLAVNDAATLTNGKSCPPEVNRIMDLSFEKNGDLWVASRYSIMRWNLRTTRHSSYNVNDDAKGNIFINSILYDKNKNIWVGTKNGLWRLDGAIWRQYFPGKNFGPLAASLNNEIWAVGGTQIDGNLYRYDNNVWTEYEFIDGATWITSMVVQSNGTIWARFHNRITDSGFNNLGIWSFDGQVWENISEFPVIPTSEYVLAQNSKGILWFTEPNNSFEGYKGSIHRFDGSTWTTYSIDIETSIDVATNSKNIVWIASHESLYSFDGNNLRTHALPIIDSGIGSIAISPDDTVCLGTDGEGVWCMQNDDWSNYKSNCP